MTLPWDDNGYRVLPSAAYMDHTEKMRELSSRFTPAVEALTREFGNLVEQAKVRLGGSHARFLPSAPPTLAPLDKVAAGTSTPFDPFSCIPLECDVLPAAVVLGLPDYVDMRHAASTSKVDAMDGLKLG